LPEAARPATASQPALQAGPKTDEKKLEALTKAAESTPSPGQPKPAAEEKPVDLSKADEKLSALLGKKP
jgi:hypothetical protein